MSDSTNTNLHNSEMDSDPPTDSKNISQKEATHPIDIEIPSTSQNRAQSTPTKNPTNSEMDSDPPTDSKNISQKEATHPIDIEIPSTSQNRAQSTPTKNPTLPLWVAGSSPAKFFTIDDILKVNDSIEKMALAHEIAIDPNFRLENMKKRDPIEEAVQKTMRAAYWDKLREDLQHDPPDYSHCLVLLVDMKQQIIDLLSEKHGRMRAEVENVLDIDLLRQQIEKNIVDMNRVFLFILDVLNGAALTKTVFMEALRNYLIQHPEKVGNNELTNEDVANIIPQVFMSVLEKSAFSDEVLFPETLKLDEARIKAMGEKFLQLVITTASIFVASNLAGKEVCETTSFKTSLKNDLILILNDINANNYVDKLENVWLQCEVEIKKHSRIWNDACSETLKNQILSLSQEDNSVRCIAKERIYAFIYSIVRSPGMAPVRLPPGLSVIQSELAALTSKFLHITNHNWKAFGTFYGQILDELYARNTN
uniref:T-complex 11 n=1 Tax=Acrobeloides nanus TaxID=290746 RepID=A0A914BV58_9BILA